MKYLESDKNSIESDIEKFLDGDMRKNAMRFADFLVANGMQFERGIGYWADKRYWVAKCQGEEVCFVLVNGYGESRHKDEPEGWAIWSEASDSSESEWYETACLEENIKEIAIQNIDYCGKCSPGSYCCASLRKTIFGEAYNAVCRTTFRFSNPGADAVECAIKLSDLRKSAIIKTKRGK